ncbi:hypothetical protein LTR93_012382, partial [Exophiala xenobiotica]
MPDDGPEPSSHTKTFGRAANILRECFGDLGEDGAVMFVSVSTCAGKSAINMRRRRSVPFLPASKAANQTPQVHEGAIAGDEEGRSKSSQSSFVAYSTESEPYMGEKDLEQKTKDIDEQMLQSLMKRYP